MVIKLTNFAVNETFLCERFIDNDECILGYAILHIEKDEGEGRYATYLSKKFILISQVCYENVYVEAMYSRSKSSNFVFRILYYIHIE